MVALYHRLLKCLKYTLCRLALPHAKEGGTILQTREPDGRGGTIRLQQLIEFLDAGFDFALAVDRSLRVQAVRTNAASGFGKPDSEILGSDLRDWMPQPATEQFGEAISSLDKGSKARFLLTLDGFPSTTILMRGIPVPHDGKVAYCFFGDQFDMSPNLSQWEDQERARELACIYEVSEWIEVSESVKEFFTHLPRYLQRGMHNPDAAVAHVTYQGIEYGEVPGSSSTIAARILSSGMEQGLITIGYCDDTNRPIPEEQKMLDEIVRMLQVALERKELRDDMRRKEEEGRDYAQRMKDLEEEISRRSREISEQSEKLGTLNSYLDRLNRDWEGSRNRLETMFKAIPDKVAMIDLKRNVIMTNRDDVLPGNKCYKTIFDSDIPCPDCRLSRIVREKTPIHIEIRHEDEYYEVHALPIFNAEHEVEGIIEFYRNVTLEKTYEQQLQQADKLASLGQLVSGIGHEINNPNQFIRGNIKIIKQAFEDILPIIDEYQKTQPGMKVARLPYAFFREHIMTLVNDMEHGSVRIKGIVDGLKNFARKDEGLLVDTVDVNTVIDATARLVHNQVHKTADIVLNLDRNLPVFTGNAQKIEQVLINLVINAGEAMPEDRRGTITVTTRTEDNLVVIEVKDDGKGMNERTLKHIFDPFYTTKRARGGTGLGLAIAYRIIEEHSGTFAVKSLPGVGTTFTIKIPFRRSPGSQRISKVEE